MKFGWLLSKVFGAQREKEEAPSQNHSYASVPSIKVPAPCAATKPVKADQISKEWNKEAQQASSCSAQLETETAVPEKVYRWQFKNYSAIAQKMKQLEKLKAADMPKKVSDETNESQVKNEEKKQDDLWRDMMKTHEERHFRLGRITNFFS